MNDSVKTITTYLIYFFIYYLWQFNFLKTFITLLMNAFLDFVANLLPEDNSKNDLDDLEVQLFDLLTIATATNDFSTENKIGEGGFGPVYKVIIL